MAISAKELPLGKVFTPDFRFTIPSFQRAYIWKTENILQLVSDLDDACKSPRYSVLPRLANSGARGR